LFRRRRKKPKDKSHSLAPSKSQSAINERSQPDAVTSHQRNHSMFTATNEYMQSLVSDDENTFEPDYKTDGEAVYYNTTRTRKKLYE